MTRSAPVLEAAGLRVQYRGGPLGLDGVSFTLRAGITGLLGANGAGKSTLLRVLATLQAPTAGQLFWNGQEVTRAPQVLRRTLGYVPQEVGAHATLTPTEFLAYMAALKGLPRVASAAQARALLAEVNLEAHAHRPIGTFSGGMRQRVGLAQALLGDPHLLVLDEPTVGLDPEERARLSALLARVAVDRVVLLATHITSDVEAAAPEVLVLADGRVAYHGSTRGYLGTARHPEAAVAGGRLYA